MTRWSLLLLVCMGCDERSSLPPLLPFDGGTSASCEISMEEWESTGAVLPSSTRNDCSALPVIGPWTSVDEMTGVGNRCPAGCTCVEERAQVPSCAASRAVDCQDGTFESLRFQRVAFDRVNGSSTNVLPDGTHCDFDLLVVPL